MSILVDFYRQLPRIIEYVGPCALDDGFSPGYSLPALEKPMRRFLSVAEFSWQRLTDHGDCTLKLFDLTRNPGTHTAKTLAALLMVARAVQHTRRTGETVMLFSPTSGNHGVALRDAVLRAIECGVADPRTLRVALLVPVSSRDKLRASRLSDDPLLRLQNPVMLCHAGEVELLARTFTRTHSARLWRERKTRLWYTDQPGNYLIAEALRAFTEHHVDPPERSGKPRIHAHAVSNAFGLLGYHAGRRLLQGDGVASAARHPGFLLVQHLAGPHQVKSAPPTYHYRPETGLHHQNTNPHFPSITYSPDEVLDSTFCDHHRPETVPAVHDVIARHGGTGIVVSLAECLAGYAQLRALLPRKLRPLPSDSRHLMEWSFVMTLTGVRNAIDRGLIAPGTEVVVNATGYYGRSDYAPLPPDATIPVTSIDDMETILL